MEQKYFPTGLAYHKRFIASDRSRPKKKKKQGKNSFELFLSLFRLTLTLLHLTQPTTDQPTTDQPTESNANDVNAESQKNRYSTSKKVFFRSRPPFLVFSTTQKSTSLRNQYILFGDCFLYAFSRGFLRIQRNLPSFTFAM